MERAVGAAWQQAKAADGGGLDPGPTSERDALLNVLTRYDIDEPAEEGLAVTAFRAAAEHLVNDKAVGHPAVYNLKMLLGEILAVVVQHSSRYRQVAQQMIDRQDSDSDDPVLYFVVARAYSKLAELHPTLIDLGTLMRVLTQLDVAKPVTGGRQVVAMMLGRSVAKIRGSNIGNLLLQALSEGGTAARIAAVCGISAGGKHDPLLFYTSKLQALHGEERSPAAVISHPPNRRLQALLYGILHQEEEVRRLRDLAKDDLHREFGIDDLPYRHPWPQLRSLPRAEHQHYAPFIGTVVKATLDNMEEVAERIDTSHVVCITGPRIVDALFEASAALLIPSQEPDSPQCRRLQSRGVPHAMLSQDRMADLSDGDHVVVEPTVLRVVSAR